MSTNNTNVAQVIGAVVSTRVQAIARWLGSFGARLLVMLLFTALLGYWLFITVWQPLVALRPLPVGVTEVNPAVDIEVLRQISAQRTQRLEYQPAPLFISGVITGAVPQE